MRRDYEIFEKFSDGSSVWRACVSGRYDAQRKVNELSEHSENRFFAIDVKAGELLPTHLLNNNSPQRRPAQGSARTT